jgi:hypothetical protein
MSPLDLRGLNDREDWDILTLSTGVGFGLTQIIFIYFKKLLSKKIPLNTKNPIPS